MGRRPAERESERGHLALRQGAAAHRRELKHLVTENLLADAFPGAGAGPTPETTGAGAAVSWDWDRKSVAGEKDRTVPVPEHDRSKPTRTTSQKPPQTDRTLWTEAASRSSCSSVSHCSTRGRYACT